MPVTMAPRSRSAANSGPGAAAGVEDPPAGHVPGEVQHRGPLVVGVEEAGLVLGRVRLGEAVVVVEHSLLCGLGGTFGNRTDPRRLRGGCGVCLPGRTLRSESHTGDLGTLGMSGIGCFTIVLRTLGAD